MRQVHLLFLGDDVVLLAGIFPETFHDVLGLGVEDLVEDFVQAGLQVGDHSVKLVDPVVFLGTHEVQVCTLVLRLLQLTLEGSVSGLEVLLELDHFQMQLVVLLDYPLILLFQWLIVHVVIGYLLLQTFIYFLELLKTFSRLQQIIQKLLGQCRAFQSYR